MLILFCLHKIKVIRDELHENGVKIDIRMLQHYTARILKDHEFIYQAVVGRPLNLIDIFHEIEVNNFGCVMVYLTYISVSNSSEQDVRRAVQLVSVPLEQCVLESISELATYLCNYSRLHMSFNTPVSFYV